MLKLKNKLIFTLLFLSFTLAAQLKINELMPKNVSAVWDDDFNFSMWVELYNDGRISLDLSDYYFSDDSNDPFKWQLPDQKINPQAFTIFWFEREERDGHVNFKLEPDGATLYIFDKTGFTVDKIKYPEQHRNISYGRLRDGGDDWGFFIKHSFNASNNGKKTAKEQNSTPSLNYEAGFYSGPLSLKFNNALSGESIYYTLDASEPTINSQKYVDGSSIAIESTTVVRAITLSDNKLPSKEFTGSYFVNERNFKLPVVSLVTDDIFLHDDTYGIYILGTNGALKATCPDGIIANYNQDWDRPTNFEFFDKDKLLQVNQELDIKIAGNCSRANPLKSIKLNPKKKHGDNEFQFDFFEDTKPNRKYNGLFYRNSGNDFFSSMFRDAFMHELIRGKLDMEYQAYLPTVCFINGEYRGIQNLRENSNHRNVFSNYNLKEEDIRIVETFEMLTDSEFQKITDFVKNNDIRSAEIMNQLGTMIDLDSYLDYMIAETYLANGDWPHNNFKMWKAIDGGKWRPILYDLDFGYGLFGIPASKTKNSILYLLEEDLSLTNKIVYLIRRLMDNEEFKNKFIDRFMLHLSTTFETERANDLIRKMAKPLEEEIVYHKELYGHTLTFESQVNAMLKFSTHRPGDVRIQIGEYFGLGNKFYNVNITSNIENANYLFNNQKADFANFNLTYFKNQNIQLEALPIKGYQFKQWEMANDQSEIKSVKMGDLWNYWDELEKPDADWNSIEFDDLLWKTGEARLGYGRNENTTIGNAKNRTTSYFRKVFNLPDTNEVSNAVLRLATDNGVVVYINGVELARYNMPEGEIDFETKALKYSRGTRLTYEVPTELLLNGENLIAVEHHQFDPSNFEALFDLSLTYNYLPLNNINVINSDVYNFDLNNNVSLKAVYEKDATYVEEELPRVFINEILSAKSKIRDEFGDRDDYIELYNDEDEAVNVAGWFISDTPIAPKMYQIPTTDEELTTIQPKSYLILWADKEPHQGPLHTNFSLSKNGEFVVLSKLDNYGELQTVDMVRFPALGEEETYSRFPDGSDNWIVQNTTFDLPNDDATDVEYQKISHNIYPTIVSEMIYIENHIGEIFRIYDVSGILHHSGSVLNQRETINLSQLKTGIYIVVVGNERVKIMKK